MCCLEKVKFHHNYLADNKMAEILNKETFKLQIEEIENSAKTDHGTKKETKSTNHLIQN